MQFIDLLLSYLTADALQQQGQLYVIPRIPYVLEPTCPSTVSICPPANINNNFYALKPAFQHELLLKTLHSFNNIVLTPRFTANCPHYLNRSSYTFKTSYATKFSSHLLITDTL